MCRYCQTIHHTIADLENLIDKNDIDGAKQMLDLYKDGVEMYQERLSVKELKQHYESFETYRKLLYEPKKEIKGVDKECLWTKYIK